MAGFENLHFDGEGLEEKLLSGTRTLVKVDPQFLRPGEVPHLIGNSTKIKRELGWRQESSFDDLVKEMYEYDLELAKIESQI